MMITMMMMMMMMMTVTLIMMMMMIVSDLVSLSEVGMSLLPARAACLPQQRCDWLTCHHLGLLGPSCCYSV